MKVEVERKKVLPVMLVDGVRYKAKLGERGCLHCSKCAFREEDMSAACEEAHCLDPNVYFVKAKKGPWIAAEGRNPGLASTTVVEWVNSVGISGTSEAGYLCWGGSAPVVRYRVFQKD